MSKVEEFIKAKTRVGSNTTNGWRRKGVFIPSYSLPWLTPDQARRAVEIAKEEMLNEICEWIGKQKELLEDWLSDLRGNKVSIKVPQKGVKLRLVKMARKNAEIIQHQKKKMENALILLWV